MLLKENSKEFQRPALGMDAARCIAVVDLGTQHGSYEGKPKVSRQIMFRFELPNQPVLEGDFAGQPLTLWSRRFTASLSEKGNLRPFLEAWRGAKFTKEELEGFDAKKTLGRPCMLTLGEEEKSGKTYTQIITISGVPNGFNVPPQVNAPLFYSVESHDQAAFEKLPEWVQKIINLSDERKGATPATGGAPAKEQLEDDIPF